MSVPPCSIPSQFRGQGTRCATRKSMRPRTCTDVGDGGEEKARAAPAAPGQSSALESGDLPTLTALLPPAASVSTHRRRVTQLRFWVQRSERTSVQRKKERARDTEIQMSPSGKENPSFELGVGRAPSSLSSEDGPHRRSGAEAGLRPPSRESALWCPSRPRLSPRVPHTHTHTHTHTAGSPPLSLAKPPKTSSSGIRAEAPGAQLTGCVLDKADAGPPRPRVLAAPPSLPASLLTQPLLSSDVFLFF